MNDIIWYEKVKQKRLNMEQLLATRLGKPLLVLASDDGEGLWRRLLFSLEGAYTL